MLVGVPRVVAAMEGEFDPYAEWLHLAASPGGFDHYALLGLARFEADPQTVRTKYWERYEQVRRYEVGAYGERAVRLLDELSHAFECLSDPEAKHLYDERLRREEHGSAPASIASQSPGAAPQAPPHAFESNGRADWSVEAPPIGNEVRRAPSRRSANRWRSENAGPPPRDASRASMVVACPHCFGVFGVSPMLYGKQAACPDCGALLDIAAQWHRLCTNGASASGTTAYLATAFSRREKLPAPTARLPRLPEPMDEHPAEAPRFIAVGATVVGATLALLVLALLVTTAHRRTDPVEEPPPTAAADTSEGDAVSRTEPTATAASTSIPANQSPAAPEKNSVAAGVETLATPEVLGDPPTREMLEEGAGDVAPRSMRWQLELSQEGVAQHALVLDRFQIELAVMGGGRDGLEYARNFAEKPTKRVAPYEEERRLGLLNLSSEAQEANARLLTYAGVNPEDAMQVQYVPPETERLLADLERKAMGAHSLNEVETTTFGARLQGDAYELYVISQRFRGDE